MPESEGKSVAVLDLHMLPYHRAGVGNRYHGVALWLKSYGM